MSRARFLGMPYQSLATEDEGLIIRLENVYGSGDVWPDLHTANHNVFRLDASGKVIWQVRRDDKGHMNWDYLNAEAKADDPTTEGYFDPFWSLGMDERGALDVQPVGVFRPGCKVYLTTRWWAYELDVETGIATCTGEQIK